VTADVGGENVVEADKPAAAGRCRRDVSGLQNILSFFLFFFSFV
jgi:hypothetical protein